jgi:hypothetical protein
MQHSTEKSLDSEDCCETTFTELDETLTNFEFDKSVNFDLLRTAAATHSTWEALNLFTVRRSWFLTTVHQSI